MKLLEWNCRGLGNAPAIRALLDVQRSCSPDVMFLSETYLESYPAECLRRRLKMDQKMVCSVDSWKGGLLLFWKKEIKIHRLELDPMFINVWVEDERNNVWRLTGMYGEFKWANKYKTWDRMRQLHHNNNLPWLLIGDLNEIQFLSEKGGNPRPPQYMHAGAEPIGPARMHRNTAGNFLLIVLVN